MAIKRDKKPRAPEPDIESIFKDILPSEAREEQPDVLPDGLEDKPVIGNVNDAFSDILGKPVANSPDPPEPGGTVDEYIRNKVLEDMYGTQTPSDYDKISLAIKRLL